MKNAGTCAIENTVTALQQAIENRKTQMHHARIQSGSFNRSVVSHLFSEVLNRAGGSLGQISLALERGGEFAKEFLRKAQQNVEESP
jgi:hypothetical protein